MESTTIYEFTYLGDYYYTRKDVRKLFDSGAGLTMVTIIDDLPRHRAATKREVAKAINVQSSTLIIFREKK